MKIFFLMIIGISILNADFVRGEYTVVDTSSKLEWQDNEIGSKVDWKGAIGRCEALVLDNKSDWRLPNINELRTIVDRSKSKTAIKSGFKSTYSDVSVGYWSSTVESDSFALFIWRVTFKYGRVNSDNESDSNRVRCVRGGL